MHMSERDEYVGFIAFSINDICVCVLTFSLHISIHMSTFKKSMLNSKLFCLMSV